MGKQHDQHCDFEKCLVLTEKNPQHESCELSFIRGKMRTTAQETAFQIDLKNCSKETGGKVSIYVILVKGEYTQSSTYFLQKVTASHERQMPPWRILCFSRYEDMKNWAHKIVS